MKTKNIILTGVLLGLGYLVYKNSNKQSDATDETATDDGSGGGAGGGGSMGGGGMLVPPMPIHILVPPLPPKVRTVISAPAIYEGQLEVIQPRPRNTTVIQETIDPKPVHTSSGSTTGSTSGSTTGSTSGSTTTPTPTPISDEPIVTNTPPKQILTPVAEQP